MAIPSANLSVAVNEEMVCLKLAGRATFAISVDFKTVVGELRQRGRSRFVVDLTECQTMDSTFLGVLSGLGQRLSEEPSHSEAIELVNANARVMDLLDNLGVLGLFKLVQCDGGVNCRCQVVPGSPVTKAELSRVSLEAHQTLMALNPANIPKFKEVARFLAEDLKKLEK